MKAIAVLLSAALGLFALSGCGSNEEKPETASTELPQIDMTAWKYEESTDTYWQAGITYCASPSNLEYQTMGIYVPGAYMSANDNGDGTFTCELNPSGTVSGFTAETAPIVIPVDTPGYSAQSAPEGYDEKTADYTSAGFVYVFAGCRGRDSGAPAGVTDLKAAIRYTRYNDGVIPGDMDRIFSFGMSGGGAQSALLGASGDSELYAPYLESIGAVSGVSDAVSGSMCWCPITSLDIANEAYEWNMGSTRTDLDDDTKQLSDGMAQKFAEYINDLGLIDSNGNALVLEQSDDGIYQSGSYYDYIKSTIEESLNAFLSATEFPYSAQSSGKGGFDRAPENAIKGDKPMRGRGDGPKDVNGELPDLPDDSATDQLNGPDTDNNDGIARQEQSNGVTISGTYNTVQDYIDALNANGEWVSYDPATNKATITSVSDFAKALKSASKNVGAFDDLNRSQGENILFGTGNGQGSHFDPIMAELLQGTDYATDFASDLETKDVLGNSIEYRMNMYNPMYYLDDYYEGYQTSEIAKYWRIRSGINQGDTALTTEVNLALALEACGADVDFATVWGQAHVEAELNGDSTGNFISWVKECCKG